MLVGKDFEGEFRRIKNGSLKITCPSVRFVVAPGYHTVALEGNGFIRHDGFGSFKYELLVRATSSNWITEINHHIPQPNSPIYFQIQFTDDTGIEWLGGELVRPRIDNIFTAHVNETFSISGKISSIVTNDLEKFGRTEKEDDLYKIIIPNAGKLPWIKHKVCSTSTEEGKEVKRSRKACYHSIDINDLSFLLEEIDDSSDLSVTIEAKHGKIPPFADIKTIEALMFTTGRFMHQGALMRYGKNQQCIRFAADHTPLKTSTYPPIYITKTSDIAHFWQVFRQFLTYLLENDDRNPFFHPFMDTLIPVMEASSRAEGVHSLTLAVAVESILKNCSFEVKKPELKVDKNELRELKKFIRTNVSDKSFRKNLTDGIGFLLSKNMSTTDRLNALVKNGTIKQEYLSSWKSLRNESAHGGFSKIAYKEGFDKDFGYLYTLANTLVLKEIGYDGPITDYGLLFSNQ